MYMGICLKFKRDTMIIVIFNFVCNTAPAKLFLVKIKGFKRLSGASVVIATIFDLHSPNFEK